jgi:hypothetical protein
MADYGGRINFRITKMEEQFFYQLIMADQVVEEPTFNQLIIVSV